MTAFLWASCINGLVPTVKENVEATMKKRKILFYISTLRSGGAARVMVNLSNAFAREGYAVTLVTNFSDIHEYILGEGVKRICLEQEESKASTVLKNIRRCSGLRRACWLLPVFCVVVVMYLSAVTRRWSILEGSTV